MESPDEFCAAVGRCQLWHRFADQGEAIVVVVFISAARHAQSVVFVLDESPDNVVQGTQGVEFKIGQWITHMTSLVLKTKRDGVHRLY